MLLSMLLDKPRSGYDLLRAMSGRFGPAYRPSPGSVYPALAALEAEGMVSTISGREARTYRVTAAGRRLLVAKHDLLAEIEARIENDSGHEPSLKSALDRVARSISRVSGRVDSAAIERILDNAAWSISELEGQT